MPMSPDVIAFLISAGTSIFISGMAVGRYVGTMRAIDTRLSRIEAMFTLVLKEQDIKK